MDKVGEKALADRLAVWLAGRYIVATRRLVENEKDPAAWKLLRELCHDVVDLRRGDHSAAWISLDRERLDMRRRNETREAKAAKSPPDGKQKRAPAMSDEEQEAAWRQIFGMRPV